MDQDRFWELLAKKKAEESTPEEQVELNQFLFAHPNNTELMRQMDDVWNLSFPPAIGITEENVAGVWDKVLTNITVDKVETPGLSGGGRLPGARIVRLKHAIVAAASILLVFSAWLFYNSHKGEQLIKQNIVSTKNGSKSKIELPDGTQVWLNAGSKLVYDENYGKSTRHLRLVGEAYFDVVHNADMPFVIETRHMNVKVLGTAFNIRAYPEDITSEASLIRGSIEVSFPGRPSEKLILKPQQKITIVNKDSLFSSIASAKSPLTNDVFSTLPVIALGALTYDQVDSSVIETSWMVNKMIFRKKDFGGLARDMERWFNVSIQFSDSTLLDRKFTGTFYNENIKEALSALQLSFPFRYRLEKNERTVLIYSE